MLSIGSQRNQSYFKRIAKSNVAIEWISFKPIIPFDSTIYFRSIYASLYIFRQDMYIPTYRTRRYVDEEVHIRVRHVENTSTEKKMKDRIESKVQGAVAYKRETFRGRSTIEDGPLYEAQACICKHLFSLAAV